MKTRAIFKNYNWELFNGEKGKGKHLASIRSREQICYLNSKYDIVNFDEVYDDFPKETFLQKLRNFFLGM